MLRQPGSDILNQDVRHGERVLAPLAHVAKDMQHVIGVRVHPVNRTGSRKGTTFVSARARERASEHARKRVSEQASKRASEQASKRASEEARKRASKQASEQLSKPTNK